VSSPNSYELATLARNLLQAGESGFDENQDADDWEAAFTGYLALASDKLSACRAVIVRAGADADFLRAEAKRLAEAAAKLDAVAVRVTEHTLALLQAHEALTGESKVTLENGVGWVKISRRNSVRCEVACDGADLPFRFQAMKITPDKAAIKAALDAGELVDGCALVPHTSESVQFSK